MRNTTLCAFLLMALMCSCVKRQTGESAEGDASVQTSIEAVEQNDSNEAAQDGNEMARDSIVEEDWSDASMPEGILQTLPKTAILCDIKGSFELYKNLDIECCDEHPNQWSLWLRDKETGKVIFLIQTNNDAEPRWEEMTDASALEVPLEQIAPGIVTRFSSFRMLRARCLWKDAPMDATSGRISTTSICSASSSCLPTRGSSILTFRIIIFV